MKMWIIAIKQLIYLRRCRDCGTPYLAAHWWERAVYGMHPVRAEREDGAQK